MYIHECLVGKLSRCVQGKLEAHMAYLGNHNVWSCLLLLVSIVAHINGGLPRGCSWAVSTSASVMHLRTTLGALSDRALMNNHLRLSRHDNVLTCRYIIYKTL